MDIALRTAIEFARKYGMKVEEVDDGRLRVTYPSGESRVLDRNNERTPFIITDMTCNMM